MLIQTRTSCRVCGSNNLIEVLSLGNQYVTNFLDDPKQKAQRAPLDLILCDMGRGGCGLLQLKHTFDHDALYKQYWYKSGVSSDMVLALADIVKDAEELVQLERGDIVIDIGSNDGTLLRQYSSGLIMKVGFEPSNLWDLGQSKDTLILHDYFNHDALRAKIGNRKARIITSIAMFYDLEDPNAFVRDIKECLEDSGIWIIQMNYLGMMLDNNAFDNISHEHLEYYSLLSLEYLLGRNGLEAFDVKLNEVNGGSFRIYIRKQGANTEELSGAETRIQKLREQEQKAGFNSMETYKEFGERIERNSKTLVDFIRSEKEGGKVTFIYGASTRGIVVLQYAGIDERLIEVAVDKNSVKWGKYIVGTKIQIISLEDYRKRKPDYLFVLPYQFVGEIARQEDDFLEHGGRIIIAMPKLMVIDKSYLKGQNVGK